MSTQPATAADIVAKLDALAVLLAQILAVLQARPTAPPAGTPPLPSDTGDDVADIRALWSATFNERLGDKALDYLAEASGGNAEEVKSALRNIADGLSSGKIAQRPDKPLSYTCAAIKRRRERAAERAQQPNAAAKSVDEEPAPPSPSPQPAADDELPF